MKKSPDAFRTISEVSDWLDTPAHVLRFWESRFTQIKPVKRAGGRRYYRPADMQLLGGIKRLLHEDGLTIRGVQKILREEGLQVVTALSAPLPGGEGVEPVGDEAPPPRPAPRQAKTAAPAPQDRARQDIPASDMDQDAPEAPMLEDAQDETEASIVPFTEHETARDSKAADRPGLFQRATPGADTPHAPAALPPESSPIRRTTQAAPDADTAGTPPIDAGQGADQGPVTAAPMPQPAPAPQPPQDAADLTDPRPDRDEGPTGAHPVDPPLTAEPPAPQPPEAAADPADPAPDPDEDPTGTGPHDETLGAEPPADLAATDRPASLVSDTPGDMHILPPIAPAPAAPVILGADLPAGDPADDDPAFAPVVPPLRTRLRRPAVHRAVRDNPDQLATVLDLLGKLAVRMDENRPI